MTQEQYERAAEIKAELRNSKAVLRKLESDEVIISVYVCGGDSYDAEPSTMTINNNNIRNTMIDYLNDRIAELKKEFEEL